MQDQTIDVRSGENINIDTLSAYLKRHVPELTNITEVRQFPGGFSNLTYLLRTNLGDWVLRRPPLGAKIKSAHDMAREYRVLEKMCPIYGRIPALVHLCEDETLLGYSFYIMERVEGIILRNKPPQGLDLSPPRMRAISEATIDNLALLHQIIQIVMGWENSHLYQFELGDQAFLETPMHSGDQDANIKIDQFLKHQSPLTYLYDFGDRWQHQLIIEDSPTQVITIPECLEGQNACPPEDSGGNGLFHQLLQTRKRNPNQTNPQWQQWIGNDWQAQAFNLDAVNEHLRTFWLWYHAEDISPAGDSHDEY